MKQKNNFKLILLTLVGVLAFSCAKERSPQLHITVIDEKGIPASGAIVHAWPGDNLTGNGSSTPGTVNEAEMDKTGTTDLSGNVTFDFKFSAVLDVDVKYFRTTKVVVSDTFWNATPPPAYDSIVTGIVDVTDSLSGHKVVKIERLRQRSKSNDYSETINLK